MAIGAFSSLLHTCIEQVLLSIDREGDRLRGATQPLLFDHPLLPCPTSNRRMCKSGKGQKASVEYLFECHVDFEPGWHHSWRMVAVTRGPSALRAALTNNHQPCTSALCLQQTISAALNPLSHSSQPLSAPPICIFLSRARVIPGSYTHRGTNPKIWGCKTTV